MASAEREEESEGEEAVDLVLWGALATLCCCPPYGVAAIAAAHKARARREEGDLAGAAEASAQAKRYLRRSVVLGLVANALGLVLIAGALYYLYQHWDALLDGGQVEGARGVGGNAVAGVVLLIHGSVGRLYGRRRGPIILAGIVVGLGGLVVWEPEWLVVEPRCLVRGMSGLECPGCGTIRGLRQAASGDLMGAWMWNPATMTGICVLAPVIGLRLLGRARRIRGIVRGLLAGWIVWMLVYGILRNAGG